MTQHRHQHLDGGQAGDHEAGLADLLDLDAEVLGSYLDQVMEWIGQHAPDAPRTVVDVGAGTGTGSLALARRFSTAEVVAIDTSALMLERLRAAARGQELADRLRVVQADLDVVWPEVGGVDVAWAASSLHHVADPDRVLSDVYAALNPGGLLVVIEMDSLPRFLPDDVRRGRPGLEARCHEALAQANWNSHPDWRSHLERAGSTSPSNAASPSRRAPRRRAPGATRTPSCAASVPPSPAGWPPTTSTPSTTSWQPTTPTGSCDAAT